MARIRKNRLNRTMTPGWVIPVEALAVALLVHVALFSLAGYQPAGRTAVAPESPGVTLLSRAGFPDREWKALERWIAVHDPSQISRSGSPSGYAALLDRRRARAVETRRAAGFRESPPLPGLPGYVPLAAMTAEVEVTAFGGISAGPEFHAPAPVRKPVVRDGDGVPVRLDRLSVPAGAGPAQRPTVVTVWGAPGFLRQHLAESSGVPALDQAAMQAVAGELFDTRKTIIVHWPETVSGAATGEEEP